MSYILKRFESKRNKKKYILKSEKLQNKLNVYVPIYQCYLGFGVYSHYTLYYLSLLKKPSGYLNITLSLTGEKYKYIYSFFQLLKISIVKIDICF